VQVIAKPWGKEELIEVNDRYMVKRLTMEKGHRCSLQLHKKKHETVYILSGSLKISSGISQTSLTEKVYRAHETLSISPGTIHRMEAKETTVYLESSTPELDDVVRLIDDYKRV
jgi:mannose-6-phosphate isomerase